MNLYRWRSEALKEYGQGYILAVGVDIEQARANALDAWNAYAKEHFGWLFAPTWELDEFDIAEREAKANMFLADISSEPEVATAFVIRGSG